MPPTTTPAPDRDWLTVVVTVTELLLVIVVIGFALCTSDPAVRSTALAALGCLVTVLRPPPPRPS